MMGFDTPEATVRQDGIERHIAAKRDEAAYGTEDTAAKGSKRTGQKAIRKKKKPGGFF